MAEAPSLDWRALGLASAPAAFCGEDLDLLGELFFSVDSNHDGLLVPGELAIFHQALGSVSGRLFPIEGLCEHLDEAAGPDAEGLDPEGWIDFHAAAVEVLGLKSWRSAMKAASAVVRISHGPGPPVEEDSWVVSVGSGGDILSTWFSREELQPDERAAVRALRDAGGWRCLSCQAEDLDGASARPEAEPANARRLEATEEFRRMQSTPALNTPGALGRGMSVPSKDTASISLSTPLGDCWRRKSLFAKPPLRQSSPAQRCGTLEEMLSHRALRPVRKTVRVGCDVVIESVSLGTCKPQHLGREGVVREVWTPEKSHTKGEWCKVKLKNSSAGRVAVHQTTTAEVMLPYAAVASFKVPLRRGDQVESYRLIEHGQDKGRRSTVTFRGTVLDPGEGSHKVEIGFAPRDTEWVPQSWIVRLMMSAWTQVLRQAPYSTLIFLLYDLRLAPESAEDLEELSERLRKDFEPHGRFRYVGIQDEGEGRDALPESDSATSLPISQGSGERLDTMRIGVGESGKVLAFDTEELQVVVVPDHKKHLRLTLPLNSIEPNKLEAQVTATTGHTVMRSFGEDRPLLAAAKRDDVPEVRKLLNGFPRDQLADEVLDQGVDGNTAFHAMAYRGSEKMWKALWSSLNAATNPRDPDLLDQVLRIPNDWGRTPVWICLESRNLELCRMLLKSSAPVDQVAPAIPSQEDTSDFCGGPGLVAEGVWFEATFYSPAAGCGLSFGTRCVKAQAERRRIAASVSSGNLMPEQGRFVVVRSFGEAAENCIMAGDYLLGIDGESVSSCESFRQLEQRLARTKRPVKLQFQKGSALQISPLQRACELGYADMVELLLEFEADPNWLDDVGRSAMDRAVRKRNRLAVDQRDCHEQIIAQLLEAGASEDGRVVVVDGDGREEPFEPPPHWSPCPEMYQQGRFWLCVDDVSDTEIVAHLQRVVDRSMANTATKGTRSRDRGGEMVPRRLQVDKVQRIQNVASLCEYLQKRHIVRGMCKEMGSSFAQDVTDNLVKVDYASLVGAPAESPLDLELEVFLFHGTTPEGAKGIAHEDFLMKLAGSNRGDAFGRGIYFAEDALKSDEYTGEAKDGCFANLRPLLLCRVLMGRVLVSEDKDVSWEVSQIMQSRYDSLLADRKAAVGTFREFIVFDEDQACAEYIIWYRRIN